MTSAVVTKYERNGRVANESLVRALVMWAVVVGAACRADLAVPANARITCATSDDCPASTLCKQSLGMCVRAAGDDGRAPVLTDATLTPSIATVGTELVLTVTTDEALGIDPDATIGNNHFTVTNADSAQQTFELRYQVRGTEAPGDQPINVTVVDVFGNAAQTVGAKATLDFVAPRIGLAVWTLPGFKRAVKPGDQVTLQVNVDSGTSLINAEMFADTTSIADVSGAFLLSAASQGLQLVGQVTIPADVQDGALISVGFGLSDIAGNVTNPAAALSPPLPVDANPPHGTLSFLHTSIVDPSESANLATDDAVSVRLEGDIQSPLGDQAPVPSAITVLFSPNNGNKTVRAIFEDAAGNQTTTNDVVINVNVPPGVGSAGSLCTVDQDCNSVRCSCADASCTAPRRCAPSTACGACQYVNSSGVCQGAITPGTVDPNGCSAPHVCGAAAVCQVARGQTCVSATECITGFCECGNAGCTSTICADSHCAFCKVGVTCSADRTNDTGCGGGQVCREGSCVTRSPGFCSAVCNGGFTLPDDTCPPFSITDSCNHAQGFVAEFTGSCPISGACRPGSPDCQCL